MKDLVDFDPGCLDDSLPLLGILFQNRLDANAEAAPSAIK